MSDYYPRLRWIGLEGHPEPPDWAHPIVEAYVTDLHVTRVNEHNVFYHVHDGRLYVKAGYKRGWFKVTPEGMRQLYGLPVLVHADWEAERVTAELCVPRSSPDYPLFVPGQVEAGRDTTVEEGDACSRNLEWSTEASSTIWASGPRRRCRTWGR